jgi:GT2 family glycosyltransferase
MSDALRGHDEALAAASSPHGEDAAAEPAIPALKNVGFIAIGRNEGERLEWCLRSVVGKAGAVVYVDSNSTDGSVALARSLGVEVVELDMSKPFSAARARNEGFARLQQILPGVQFVQMVDGDCEVVDGWMQTAVQALEADENIAVVCGRRRERHPGASIYNRLCDMEWDTPIGQARSCGGDAMFRAAALEQVGGYNPSVIAGEEPELCVRLRQAGYKVQRLDAEMTLHDANMHRFSQWWKRNVRAGHAYAQGMSIHGAAPEKHNVKPFKSIVFWALLIPIAILWMLIGGMLGQPLGYWIAGLLALGYPLLMLKVARYRKKSHGDPLRHALPYGLFTVIGKFANLMGIRKYIWNMIRGRDGTIIEYKGTAAGTAAPSR